MSRTSIIAHRGVSQVKPENTLLALEMAIDSNCDGIEFDVQLTKDNIPVIIHDETIDRTSNGKGYVSNYTLEQLKKYNFGINFNYQGVTIPTLNEFLQLTIQKKYSKLLNIEIKNDILHYPNIEEKILDLVLKYNLQDQVLFSSFNHQSMFRMRKLSETVNIALLYEDTSPNLNELIKINAYSAHFNVKMASKELLESLNQKNIKSFFYTVNDPVEIKRLLDMGVDGIFSDNPQIASNIVTTDILENKLCYATI